MYHQYMSVTAVTRALIHEPWQMQAGKLMGLPITRAGACTKNSLGAHASSSSSSSAFYCCTSQACHHSKKLCFCHESGLWATSKHISCAVTAAIWVMTSGRHTQLKAEENSLYVSPTVNLRSSWTITHRCSSQVSHRYPMRCWTNLSAPVAIAVKLGFNIHLSWRKIKRLKLLMFTELTEVTHHSIT